MTTNLHENLTLLLCQDQAFFGDAPQLSDCFGVACSRVSAGKHRNKMEPWQASQGLPQGAIRLREVLFQSVTAMAPAGAVSFPIVVGAAYAGGALTLAVVFAFLPCLTVAVSIAQLAKHLPSAGSIYTYPSRAFHPTVGFLVGWGYALAAATWCPAIALILSVQIAGVVTKGIGGWFNFVWMLCFITTSIIVLFLGYYGIRGSTKVGTVIGAIEILVFLVLAGWLIIEAGRANTAAPFGLGLAKVSGYQGIAGVFAAAVFVVQGLTGFEAATPLAEEALNPRITIARATLYSCTAIGIFFVITTYAATVTFGTSNFQEFAALLQRGSPWFSLARRVWGVGWIIILLAVINSQFAGQNAFSNAATRTWYALARIRLLPKALSRIHPEFGSPYAAVVTQFVYTLLVGGLVGLLFGPVNGGILLATLCTAIPLGVYILINAACISYYWRYRPKEFRWLLHGLLPLGGAILLIPVLLTALGVSVSFLKFITPLPYPISLIGPILGIWFVVGLICLTYAYARHPERLEETTRIFLEEAETSSERLS
jgi:amino acid transporter